jgi:hypothetical protein
MTVVPTDLLNPSVSSKLHPSPMKTRTLADGVAALPGALRSEWIKLVSLRSTYVIGLFTLIVGLVVSWAVASFPPSDVESVETAWFYWTAPSAVLASVVGVMIFTADVQHGGLPIMLTVQPERWIIAIAKTVIAVGAGLMLGTVSATSGIAGAALTGIEWGSWSAIAAGIPWALGYTALTALLGLGVGLLARSSALAIAGVLIWGLLIEGLLTLFLPTEVGRFLPFLAGDRMLAFDSQVLNAESATGLLTRAEGALVLAGYTALLLIAGTVSFSRRDVA